MSGTASQFVKGFGSSIAYATITAGVVGTYTKVVQTVDVSSPMPEVGDIKVTNNDSPNNTHEYAPGIVEPGDVEYQCVYYKSGHETLLGFVGNGIIYSWQETFADGSTCTFPGYLKSAGVEGKTEDDALKGKLKVKLTGAPVWA